ncbi:MAG TPA: hypothetical protein VKQ72_00950 [Aggregatilineales bacterium]|nr:hypothetical protein [Aggregatilineales bacterium]
MANSEEIETLRQQIMRFRELLNIMRLRLDEGEKAHAKLFTAFSVEQRPDAKEKDLQWQLAEKMYGDTSALRKAALTMRFHSRDFEKAFEELHDLIVAAEQRESAD